jgi:sugar lactone lactonase YvrE
VRRPRRGAALAALLVSVATAAAAPAAAPARDRFDTRVLALVPKPGFPAHAYVHPNGRIYAGTYDNPSGDTVPSRVFEYDGTEGTLLRSWTVQGQDLTKPHGVQAATSDARGRIVLLDKSPPRILLLDRSTGEQIPYASFPDGSIPNYAAWGPDGSLYVTDYGMPILWRVPPGGEGPPEPWLQDPRFDGGDFGTTGLALAADQKTLLVAVQSQAGGAGGNPSTGRIFKLPIQPDGRPGTMTQLWESRPVDGPDGFAVADSGTLYVTLLAANQIAVVGPDGAERERFPSAPGSGENGSPVPFDSPSSARFLDTRLIVAQQSYFTGDPTHQAILDVEAGEEGLDELIPFNAGLRDALAPRLKRISLSRARLRFRLNERADVYVVFERRSGTKWRRLRESYQDLDAGTWTLSVRRLAGKPNGLRPGRYRATIRAIDKVGNEAAPIVRGLRIR